MGKRFKTSVVAFLMMFGLCLQASPTAFAADASDRMLHKVVIDNTITYSGHEFYRHFVHYLMLETGNVYFDQVTLKEYKSRRSGSSIHIEFAQKTLYHTTVYAGNRVLAGKAKRAARIVSAKISKAPINALFSQAGDLAGDEL